MNKTYIATMGERFFMSKIAIATDSNSGITQAQGRELGIFVMPMPFYINDELFLEDITLSQEQFYQRLEEGADVKTTQPAPGDVLELSCELVEQHGPVGFGKAAAKVDGKLAATVAQAPYYYNLNTAALGGGEHKIYAVASGNQFKQQSGTYTLTVPGSTKPAEQTPSSWAEALIVDAQSKGLITERTKGIYQDQITRLQFAELAVNMIEKATGQSITPAQDNFTDTNDTMALKAVAAGVTSGKGEGIFAPNTPITRQEISVMLNKAIQYVDAANGTATLTNTSTVLDSGKFKDAGTVDSWAVESMALLTNNNLMAGQGSNVNPKANTTVEEAIVLIRALYDKF